MNEWGTPVSKEKIIARRNRLIEYQKIGEVRFTPLYQVIDENILDINYMIYEIERLNNKLEKIKEIINYYAVEDEDYSKIYNDEEKELLKVLGGDE